MTLDYLALPLILYVGVAASWTDFRQGKIRNRHILMLLLGALLFHATAAMAWGLGAGWRSPAVDTLGLGTLYLHTLTNAVISLFISFLLWTFKIWAAGDAKLFAALAFAIPLGLYRNDYLPWFPSFVLFFNTFIGILAWLLVELLLRAVWWLIRRPTRLNIRPLLAEALAGLKEKWPQYLKLIVGFMAMLLAIRVLRKLLRWGIGEVVVLNKTLMYAALLVVFHPVRRFFMKRWAFFGALGVLVAYCVWAFGFASDNQDAAAILHLATLTMGVVVLFVLYHFYTLRCDVRKIPVGEVEQGMILSHAFTLSLSRNSEFNNERMGKPRPDGLTGLQLETLRTWYNKSHEDGLDAEAEISTTIPFAPGMLVGAALTIWLGGYLFQI